MPQNIEVNGEVIQFPDGMSDDQIAAAIRSMGGGPPATAPAAPAEVRSAPEISNPLVRYPAMVGSEALRGLDITLGLPGELEQLSNRYVSDPLSRLMGLQPTAPTSGPWGTGTLLPTPQTLLGATGRLGLTQRSDLAPGFGTAPGVERFLSAGAQGLGGAAPVAALAPEALPVLAAGTGGGLAAQGAREALPGVPGAPLAAGLVVGGGAQGVRSLLSGNTFERVAAGLGESKTLQDAGEELQDAARQWRNVTMPQMQDEAWAPVNSAMAAKPVNLTAFSATLDKLVDAGNDLNPLKKLLGNTLPARLQNALENKTPFGLGMPTSWENARALRTYLGDNLDNPKLVQDIGQQHLNELYSALTRDLRSSVQTNGGPETLSAFDAANAESTRLHAVAQGPMSRVISDKNASVDPRLKPEDVASRLLSGGTRGASDLATLRAEIPDAVDELTAAKLRTDPLGWAKLSPEAREALITNSDTRAAVDRAALNPPTSLKEIGTHALESLVGSETVGGPLGILVGRHFLGGGYGDELTGEAVGRMLGAASPWVWRNAATLARNPRLLALPVAGGLGSVGPGVPRATGQ